MSAPEDERVREAREWCAAYAAAMGPEVGEVEHDAPNHVLTLLAYIDERAASEPDLPADVREWATAYEQAKTKAISIAVAGDWFDFAVHEARIRLAEAVLRHITERAKGGAE